MYEGTRSAIVDDVPRIQQLLRPLEADGVLVQRSREQVCLLCAIECEQMWLYNLGFLII